MPTIMEVAFYTPVNILPVLTLALIPFRDNLRFSVRWLVLLTAALCVVDGAISWAALCVSGSGVGFTVLASCLYLGFYLSAVRTGPLKLLAMLFILMNYATLSTVTASFLVCRFPADIPQYPYSAAYTVFYALGLMLAYPLYYRTLNLRIRPQVTLGDNEGIWRYLWMIPATFCAVNNYCIFSVGTIMEFVQSGRNVLFLWLVSIGSLMTLHMVAQLLEEARENLRLQKQNSLLALQSAQYEPLKRNIEEARRARHDLRHHLAAIQDCIDKQDLDALSDYMTKYRQTLPLSSDEDAHFCSNYAVNAVLCFYAEKAAQIGADMTVRVHMGKTAIIPDPELCVLLGNLLENALESSTGQEGAPFIRVNIQQSGTSMLTLTVDNACPQCPVWEQDRLRSSKREGFGLGTDSVRMIAEQYHGDARFAWKDGVFYASVVLSP